MNTKLRTLDEPSHSTPVKVVPHRFTTRATTTTAPSTSTDRDEPSNKIDQFPSGWFSCVSLHNICLVVEGIFIITRGSDHIVTVSAVDLCIAQSSAQNAFKVASNSISSSFLKLAELVLDHKDNLVKTSTKLGY